MSNPLDNYNILVVDADLQLAKVFKAMLSGMGFENVDITRSGEGALERIESTSYDFLITERNTRHLDGLSLIKNIRHASSPHVAMPIIMLSNKAEKEDVLQARDKGVNEYLLKPFAIKMIYNRIERIVETPREFVISKNFVGPDRRGVRTGSEDKDDERRGAGQPDDNIPIIWTPDYSLKKKLPGDQRLSSYVDPDIFDAEDIRMQKISEDINAIERLHHMLQSGAETDVTVANLCGLCLQIKSSAAQFGHQLICMASEGLYLFCREKLRVDDHIHQIIIAKHIEVLRTALRINPARISQPQSDRVIKELHNLVSRLAPA